MADKREMGPKRSTKIVYIVMALIVLVVVTTFVGMNISHKNQMTNSQADGTSTQTQDGGQGHAPTGTDQPPR